MPTIYKYFGLFFIMHTDDHEPINIHVIYQGQESIIEIIRNPAGQIIDVRKRRVSTGHELAPAQLATALKFVNIKAEEIVQAWRLIRNGEFKQKPIIITRKIV